VYDDGSMTRDHEAERRRRGRVGPPSAADEWDTVELISPKYGISAGRQEQQPCQ